MANKKSIIPHFVLGIVIGYLVNRIIELYQSAKPPNQLIAAMEFPQAIMQHPLSFSLEKAPIWGFLGTLVLIVLMYFLRDSREYMLNMGQIDLPPQRKRTYLPIKINGTTLFWVMAYLKA